jgi:4-hydroxy-4-methyl-2-oxoglutarate aldolase
VLEQASRLSTATVLAALGTSERPDPEIRPLVAGSVAAGPAVTCRCPAGDVLSVILALDESRAGDVLVVETDPEVEIALFGGVLAGFAVERGLAGVVTNGWVRDAAEIRALGLPVWARGIRLAGPTRELRGELGTRVRLGSLPVEPGDLILADDDGAVAVPAGRAREVVERAAEREAHEAGIVGRIRAGASLAEAMGLDVAAG